MDFSLNEQQEMLKTMARDFCEKELSRKLVDDYETSETGYPPAIWNKMTDLGWQGLLIPEQYGGADAKFLDFLILLEEMGRGCITGPFFTTTMLGGMCILLAGNEKQKQNVLSLISNGKLIITLALSEEDSCYKSSTINTRAHKTSNGYVINGKKLFVPHANVADKFICVAKTEEGITLLLVDKSNQGIEMIPLNTLSRERQFEVIFKDVKVHADSVIGSPGKGWETVEEVLLRAKVAKCAEMIGMAQKALDMAVEYAKQRIQFDQPIGSFQAIQHYCANMLTDIESSRFITYKTGWLLDERMPCAKEAAIAKGWTSSACQCVIALAHQIHGAIGFTLDHDLGRYFKRLKEAELIFGNEEIQKEIIAIELGL